MNRQTSNPIWRGWLLLAVALWMSFAPAAIAAGVPRFVVEPASVGGEESSAGPGLHIYLYANANPVMGFDPSGRLTLAETALVGGAVGIWSSVIAHTLRKENPISPLQGLTDALISGGIGAVSGVVSFQVSFFLKQIGIASPLIKGAFAGGASGAAGQFLKELVSWVSGKPVTFSESGGRIVEAAFGGFIAGGILSPIKVKFERPVPQWISHEGGIGSGASVVVLRYTDYGTVYSSAGLVVVPFLSVLQTLIKNEVLDYYESHEQTK